MMNREQALAPPIGVILGDLGAWGDTGAHVAGFTPPVAGIGAVRARERGGPVEMPEFMRDLIRRRWQADRRAFEGAPAPGRIVWLPDFGGAGRPVAFLVAAGAGRGRWRGWPVVGESAYAGSWDFILQEGFDDPIDPSAVMVQVWNPLEVKLPDRCRVVSKLSPSRFSAVVALAGEFRDGRLPAARPFPGRVGLRVVNGHEVVTGTPLGGPGVDPRWVYQRAYSRWSGRLARETGATAWRLWVDAALKRLAGRLRQWARDAGAVLVPQDPIPHPLGGPPDERIRTGFRMDGQVELWLSVTDERGFTHVRVRNLSESRLFVKLVAVPGGEGRDAGPEVVHSEVLDRDGEAHFVAETDSGTMLLLERAEAGQVIEIPVT